MLHVVQALGVGDSGRHDLALKAQRLALRLAARLRLFVLATPLVGLRGHRLEFAHAALELYAEAFENAGALDRLEAFASFHGADFYRLPRNRDTITLVREPWSVPAAYPFGADTVVLGSYSVLGDGATAMVRLDQNRAQTQLAKKAGVDFAELLSPNRTFAVAATATGSLRQKSPPGPPRTKRSPRPRSIPTVRTSGWSGR